MGSNPIGIALVGRYFDEAVFVFPMVIWAQAGQVRGIIDLDE